MLHFYPDAAIDPPPVPIDAYDLKNERLFVGWQQVVFQTLQTLSDILAIIVALRPPPLLCARECADAPLDDRSANNYTMNISSILYFQRKTSGSALISSKY